jgi:hypothetical protein
MMKTLGWHDPMTGKVISNDDKDFLGEAAAHYNEPLGSLDALNSMTNREGLAVSPDIFWRYDPPPRSTKIFLLNTGGVAIAPGHYMPNSILGWHPLFKRNILLERGPL